MSDGYRGSRPGRSPAFPKRCARQSHDRANELDPPDAKAYNNGNRASTACSLVSTTPRCTGGPVPMPAPTEDHPTGKPHSNPRSPRSIAQQLLSLPVHDNWWQTETGSIMIANVPGTQIRPGSMGRPLPDVEAAVLERGPNGRAQVVGGRVHVLDGPGAEGELALRPGWPAGPPASAAPCSAPIPAA
ncbi:hypothetical protein SBRY_30439 [Actinacidiphila bryophytorum]|uniref:Uncharacterized protein n=1 Tax=Actinacidiphila bryophytorum TaxID=1436133 RepID=A0A9W4MF13_9ACTN|nr:hypothetical protein SBRY_30439 [Actinacidiphila bryophytorum]